MESEKIEIVIEGYSFDGWDFHVIAKILAELHKPKVLKLNLIYTDGDGKEISVDQLEWLENELKEMRNG